MKIIDLLNKIANGEEVPDYVKYYDMLHDKVATMMVCKENIFYKLDQLEIQLNSRVEPIEEKKIPEKLNLDKDELLKKVIITAQDYVIEGKINEIIDTLEMLNDKIK